MSFSEGESVTYIVLNKPIFLYVSMPIQTSGI